MPLGRKANLKVGSDFAPIPSDKYTVQVLDVNFVTQFNKFKGEDQEMLNYKFAVLDEKEMEDSEETTRGRFLWLRVNQSLNKRSKLYQLASAVLGRDLTSQELDPESKKFFNPESLIGAQLRVLVSEDENDDGRVFNNIAKMMPVKTELEPIEYEAKEESAPKKTSTKSVVDDDEDDSPVKTNKNIDLPNLNPTLDEVMEEQEKKTKKVEKKVEVDVDEDEEDPDEELRQLEEAAKKARARKEKMLADKKAKKPVSDEDDE